MKKLLPTLSIAMIASTATSCSSPNDTASDEPQFQQTSTAASSSTDATESSEESPSPTTSKKEEKAEDKDDSGLKERDPQDFLASSLEHFPNPIPAVASADGRVRCLIFEEADVPTCAVDFADPPIYPGPTQMSWRSNLVAFQDDRGFYPSWAIEFYTPGEMTPLNEGESVTFDTVSFEAPSANEITVKAKGHHFTVKDDGQYYSDTFPPKPDGNGNAFAGTVCGQIETSGGETGNVYVREDGTNCADAMEILDNYVNHDWQSGEGGSRGMLPSDLGMCSYSAPRLWEDIPENRMLGCSLDSGGSVVVITPRDMGTLR